MFKIHIIISIILYQLISVISLTPPPYKPLIFNPLTLEIYDVENDRTTYEKGPYAAACPASNKDEQEFNKIYSLNYKSLFVRHYSKKIDRFIYRIRCQSEVKLAVAYYTEPIGKKKYLTFGFEIYFDEGEGTNPEEMNKISSYFDYEQAVKSKIGNFLKNFSKNTSKVPVLTVDGMPIYRRMGFIWIPKTTLETINSILRADRISYSINKTLIRPATECNNYKLHRKLHEIRNLDKYYSPKHQKEIFKSVKLSDDDCEPNNVCVTKYSLVPAYQFQIYVSKPVSCTNLTTIPVWSKTTAPLLDHLDKFLFAVSQVVDNLTISANVDEILTLPILNTESPELLFMYLNSHHTKRTLPIPRLIFKLVAYKSHDCDENETLCWFLVVIVIQNEPIVNEFTKKVCPEDKCEQLGWTRIQYPNTDNPEEKSEHIYCCEVNEMKEILGFSTKIKYQNLSLTQFPRYKKNTKRFEYENRLNEIQNEMDYLFGDLKSSFRQKSWNRIMSVPKNIKYVVL